MFSEHRHSGKLLPHHHTSYAGLFFLLLLTAIFITGFALPSQADSLISARINGPAPTQGGTIYDPVANQTFTTSPILVSGHCPDNTYVKLTRNGILAGSLICPASLNFSLTIDLVVGANALQAQDYDFSDQPGPPTPTVTVIYSPTAPKAPPLPQITIPSSATPKVISAAPFLITAGSAITKNLSPNQLATWQIKLSGGDKPYAINWGWGDGSANIYSQASAGTVTATHSYKKAGRYTIKIHATDSSANEAQLQLVAVVVGADSGAATTGIASGDGNLAIAWPLWLLAALMMGSFWVGDKYKHRHPAQIPPLPAGN